MTIEQSDIIKSVNGSAEMSVTNSAYLSGKETREILTPFAFEIDKSLFGLPLAVPKKRAIALFIDFIFISILAETPGQLLALVAALTFYKLGSKSSDSAQKKKRSIRKALLRGLGAIILFITVLSYLSPFIDNLFEESNSSNAQNTANKNIGVINSFAISAITMGMNAEISKSKCKTEQCWSALMSPLLEGYFELGVSSEKMMAILSQAIEKTNLSQNEQGLLVSSLNNDFLALTKTPVQAVVSEPLKTDAKPTASKEIKKQEKEEKPLLYKGVDWIKQAIENLGLSFGWAALYFSVLTSVWKGQTLGKRFMKIRVIQLDGTPLSVWDSFGRYGGYGAGLATGLMGFLQIYWDPNRQCIHDKISSTVVIDLKKLNKQK